MSDKELLGRIKKTPDGFTELFILYYKAIFGYIFRRTGNFDDTADIASETFYKAFRHIKYFSYKGIAIKIWLYRIATNEVNMYFRNRQKRGSLFEYLDISDKEMFNKFCQDDRVELEKLVDQNKQFQLVLDALKKLPSKYQDVLSLRYFEEKSIREIAEILNLNEGTVKSLLSRGVEKLRKICNQI